MDNSTKSHLSFTIGPVQGFVSQARRTRDLWAGSWLLSHLAEVALASAENCNAQGQCEGKAVIPFRGDDAGKITSLGTAIGGMPNRFELEFDSEEQAKQAAIKATEAFNKRWSEVAELVYQKYVAPVEGEGNGTRDIWKRQVDNFWEISWVIGTPEEEANTLTSLTAARKNIRNVNTTEEEGIKCSLMGSWQELSGYTNSNQQKEFWNSLRKRLGTLDIKEGERLCAIALVKRLFPRIIEEVLGEKASKELRQVSWPSTAFIAALPWLKSLKEKALDKAKSYSGLAKQAGYQQSEREAARQIGEWAGIDGPAWFTSAIQQDEPGREKENRDEIVNNLRQKLKDLYDEADSKPVPYYALLLMDGDSMGKLVSSLGDPAKVSEGLNRFADQVDDIVKKYDGRTIYAGGDDVLAILPAQGALKAADDLSKKYNESFGGIEQATLSGAIIYAHWKYPLRQVLETAHHLLDDIAKERTGRDSLAIGIIQGSGLQAVWSAPWLAVRGKKNEQGEYSSDGFERLDTIIDRFGTSSNDEKLEFNASYLYHLREQYSKLFAKPIETPGEFGQVDIGEDLLVAIANSELFRSATIRDLKDKSDKDINELVTPLIALSHQWTRDENRNVKPDKKSFSFDGWRVARFLKQVKEGKFDGHE